MTEKMPMTTRTSASPANPVSKVMPKRWRQKVGNAALHRSHVIKRQVFINALDSWYCCSRLERVINFCPVFSGFCAYQRSTFVSDKLYLWNEKLIRLM
jgi:hypothetical protein